MTEYSSTSELLIEQLHHCLTHILSDLHIDLKDLELLPNIDSAIYTTNYAVELIDDYYKQIKENK